MRTLLRLATVTVLAVLAGCAGTAAEQKDPGPPPFPSGWRVVDLTRPIDAETPYLPHASGFPFERLELGAGVGVERTGAFSMLETMGTRIGAPAAYEADGSAVERVVPARLVADLVVLDAPAALVAAPDGSGSGSGVGVAAIRAHELKYGRIPVSAVVVLRTGIGERSNRELGRPGVVPEGGYAFHGWSTDAVAFLARERRVLAVGSDAPAVDAGPAVADAPAARIAAGEGIWTVTGLTRVAGLPRTGAVLVLGVLPVTGATGSPARILALVPKRAAEPRRADR